MSPVRHTSLPRETPPEPPPGQARVVGRAPAQRLLVTLLGDYWEVGHDPLPSGGLVALLAEFGIAPANARATLSRLTQRGLLARAKAGRRTSYQPTERAWHILQRGAQRIFAASDGTDWDGTWTLIAFTLPLDDADLRRLLRARLRWLTFWPLYDATWVTPHDRADAVQEQLSELGISDALVLRSTDLELLPGGKARLEAAWRIDELAASYQAYLERYGGLADRAAGGAVRPAEALVVRTELTDDWRALVRDDPDLPREFLPASFPRARAREMFLRTYQALEELATTRFHELIHQHGAPS